MKKRRQRGSSAVEMAMSLLILMPLLMGTSVIGMNLLRAIQVTQLCRDVAHMYAYGLDFKTAANQTLLTHLAQGLNVQTSGGNGVVIFSTVTFVAANDCTSGGLQANTTSCPNMNRAVFTRRFTVGDASKLSSHYGTPVSGIVDSDGYIGPGNYLKDVSARANGFTSLMSLNSGQYAYLTEAFVAAPDLDWKGYMHGTGTYAFNIF
ncbi:MAG TPA: hypothetical protein VGH38_27815 [Bryobacteraceae bacterium]|jgi:hypothetical protein